uniref:HECT domain-containing protein n=1 Tax=Rhabditophanes sp. KR3021 TaxID=114890 RepID=A0AC35TM40_9BILA
MSRVNDNAGKEPVGESKRKMTIKTADLSEEEKTILKTLRAYYKILQESKDVSFFLNDDTFNATLVQLIDDRRHSIITYLTKILLILTEKVENAKKVASLPQFSHKLSEASEHSFPPKIIKYLLVIQSRLESSKLQRNVTTGNINRKMFYMKDAKQLVFQFDHLTDAQREDVEKACLKLRGVLSISVDIDDMKCIVRVKEIVDSRDVAGTILGCGFEMIKQVIRGDSGETEFFEFYKDQLLDENAMQSLPQYLDDHIEIFNPENCIITNDDLRKVQASGGWMSTIKSFLW